jgi:YegS/Rv2252/BmrU family lipid kinase
MSRAAVVYNPTKVEDLPQRKQRVDAHLIARGWAPAVWFETTEEDPGVGMARQAVADGFDLVYVAGGDGTVMAVATGLAGSDVRMALLPAGTGNLLARNLGLPLSDEEAALKIGTDGAVRAIDVAGVEDRKFTVMAGLGFDAAMMRDAPEGLKKRLGWPAYVVSATKHLRGRGIRVTITVDDGDPLHRRVRTVLVGNVGKLQGGLAVLPDAEPDDGMLDVVVIAPRNVVDWARVAGRVARRADVPDRRMERLRGRHIVIDASRPQPRQLDGDVIEDGRVLDIRIEPGALKVMVTP